MHASSGLSDSEVFALYTTAQSVKNVYIVHVRSLIDLFIFFKEWADLNILSDSLDEYCWYVVTFALATVGMDKRIILKMQQEPNLEDLKRVT